jgi:hypothetical protein
LINYIVAEIITIASFIKLIKPLEKNIKDSVEIITSKIDSLLIYIKRSTIYIKKKGISLIDIFKIRGIELITNLKKVLKYIIVIKYYYFLINFKGIKLDLIKTH